MKVAAFLSLLKGHPFRKERRDIKFWSPNPVEGFTCRSLLNVWLIPLP